MTDSFNETPVVDLLTRMTVDSAESSTLDDESLAIARIAALIAADAPAASYLLNLGAAADLGLDADQVQATLVAVAPIVGTARVVSAAGAIGDALGFAIEVAALAETAEA